MIKGTVANMSGHSQEYDIAEGSTLEDLCALASVPTQGTTLVLDMERVVGNPVLNDGFYLVIASKHTAA